MTTPRNSVNGTFPADSIKGPSTTQPGQKTVLRRGSLLQSPTLQSFFRRESKALGYITSGSFLVAAEKTSRSCLVNTRLGMNAISLFSSISGMILLIMDIFNLTVSHFLKLPSLNLVQTAKLNVNIFSCEQNDPPGQSTDMQQYCLTVKPLFLGILAIMLIFTFLQNLLVACIAEDEWKTLCSGTQTGVLLLSAEERKEQVVQLTVEPSQPKDEEEMETLPAQEEEKEAHFPDPPQESSPPEDDSGSP
ncbi:B-lymphocyte antigen CD20 isoform X2 [Vombatus ursinus]|uniref:B-lymphocyte antigen CD20 isoform X2 n=1 Tax=Vombatus ursinus TaxID=29139 RepID=UPI000FFD0594|nr:B-lymphocyte antigen CD20 isoform X2 [Vombatus ursinus]